MNTTERRLSQNETRPSDPIEVAARPLSLLALAGISIAIVGAVLAVAAGLDNEIAMIFGLGLFIAGTTTGLTFAGPFSSRFARYGRPDRLSDRIASRRASGLGGFRGSSMQLGPDPEQVIGRHTGARI